VYLSERAGERALSVDFVYMRKWRSAAVWPSRAGWGSRTTLHGLWP